ncbi:hypothetical protein ACG33_07825 [Steroidobacter denitrificans]|uniref:Uncharacterized protein n=1 Tax=Steroidobacter denitrificans TaxID=465721 RepID=A0A127FBM5_STEDE|nr:DUF3653 domain-containing protein [Steroidobacter denitrificans]AMN47005.1 hypothetical protein ACG33_07825 [Steroidobacter denitrificans]
MDNAALDMEPLRGFANYGARRLAHLTHSTERAARGWIKTGLAPRLVIRWLELTLRGQLQFIRSDWDGWELRKDGRLHSPDGSAFTIGELTAYGLNMQLLRELQRRRDGVNRMDGL